MTLQQKREQRGAASARITELAGRLVAEKRDFKADELRDWDKANADYDRLGREIQLEERAEQVRREQERPAGDRRPGREDHDPRERRRRDNTQATAEQRSLCFRAWAKSQYGRPLRRREREACRALRFDPRCGELEVGLWPDAHRDDVKGRLQRSAGDARADVVRRESRASMSAQLPTAGGYLVSPGTLAASFEMNMLAFGGVRQVAEELTTQSGEPYLIPVVDDTGNSGVMLGESTSIGTGVNPALRQKRLDAYKFSSTPVLIPSELLDDDNYDLESQLGEMLGIRIGRATAPKYATGTGASEPEGIVTGSTLGKTAAGAAAILFDELVELEHSVDPAYRSMPGVGWLMHDGVVSYIRRIKDSQNRPLWTNGEMWNSGMKDGVPDKLLGYPINVCQEMQATVATATKTVLFGQLSKYLIRRVKGMRLFRLVERYRDVDQDGFVAFVREDGKLRNAGTPPVKHLLQA